MAPRTRGITPLLVCALHRIPILNPFYKTCSLCATIPLSLIFRSPPLANLYLGVLTKEFLDFSASRGNNLRSIGLEPGCKWCLCTARWKEAMEAAKSKDDPVVPKCVHSANPSPIMQTNIRPLRHTESSSTQATNRPSPTASQWTR